MPQRDNDPPNCISFEQAFECVFDAVWPDATGLRHELESALKTNLDLERSWTRRDFARKQINALFRSRLVHGALVALVGGEQLDPKYWQEPTILPGRIFSRQTEFDLWLKISSRHSSRSNVARHRGESLMVLTLN